MKQSKIQNPKSKIGTLFFSLTLLALSVCVGAGPHGKKKHHGSAKKGPTAQEAKLARQRKGQLNRQLAGLRGKAHHVRAKIHIAAAKVNQVTESIETVQGRLARTRQKIGVTQARLGTLESRHDELETRLEETQERLTTRRRLLAARVRDNYERGKTTYAQALLQSRSVHEMLSRQYYVKQIVQSDAKLIQGVRDDIAQIKDDTRQLEQAEAEQRTLAAEYETQKVQLVSDMRKEREILHTARAEKAQAQDELDDIEDEAGSMTARIQQLSELLRRRQEAARREEAARRLALRPRRNGKKGRTPRHEQETADTFVPGPTWHGGFRLPVNGRITSGFGYRYHPILHRRKLHTGIDFGVHSGTPIHAAGGGTVLMASYSRGYGNCVIIDHGGGRATLYGHCASLCVSAGQSVSQGQLIAYSGSTGMSTGPHLHWEVRRNGVPVRP